MDYTRRAIGYVVLATGIALLAVILARPLLLVGAVGLGAWVLGRQWQFVRTAAQTKATLTLEHQLPRDRAAVDDTVTVEFAIAHESQIPVSLTATATPPVATTGTPKQERTLELSPEKTSAETSYTVTTATAGQHRFRPITITLTAVDGLFRTQFQLEHETTLHVEPRSADDIHVGKGGEEYGAFGAFETGQSGEGITPAELRQYVPGDAADRIDWNATARLSEPHVREFDVETDHRLFLVVDHRSSLATGPDGERKLDYLRQVALSFLATARAQTQPIGLLAIGDNGVSTRRRPSTGADHYTQLSRDLLALDATQSSDVPSRTTAAGKPIHAQRPATARNNATTLTDGSVFAQQLRPFFAATVPSRSAGSDRPLVEAVQRETTGAQGPVATLVFSDEQHVEALREAITVGTQGDNRVAAFLAPTVLYERAAFGELPTAYERYVEFESLRQDLASTPRAEVYEVAPEARIEALLAARRRRDFA